MGLFGKFLRKKASDNAFSRIAEETLYQQALTEVESGKMKKGVYAKALADSSGDAGRAQSLYLKYRVQSLIDEEIHRMDREAERELERRKAIAAAEKADFERKYYTFVIIVALFCFWYFELYRFIPGIIDSISNAIPVL